ncbi:hypothetical protein [Clostridium butyricum]|uniref:hypothetical protein n=1 Tax=Clostridium butyricum TaxID=1492 RepID=UPI00374F643D
MKYKEMESELKICYRKLKSSAYFDKSAAILRQQISEFESNTNCEMHIKDLSVKMKLEEESKWEVYIEQELQKLKVYRFPKNIDYIKKKKTDNNENIIFNIEKIDDELKIKNKDDIQFRIGLPISLHILSVFWINQIGTALDEKFSEISYGNRLLKNDKSNKNRERVPYLYKPYFNEYESWRDKGLDVAEEYYKNKTDCMIIMLDIKRFFYSVNFTPEIFDTFIDEKDKEYTIKKRLNDLMYKIIEKYSSEINSTKEKNVFLPIEFYHTEYLLTGIWIVLTRVLLID